MPLKIIRKPLVFCCFFYLFCLVFFFAIWLLHGKLSASIDGTVSPNVNHKTLLLNFDLKITGSLVTKLGL